MFLKANSFNDFEKLILKGQLKMLSFGQYSFSKFTNPTKNKKRKVITYFYKNLLK